MNKSFLVALVALGLFLSSCKKGGGDGPDDPDPPEQNDIANVDNAIATFMTNFNIPGASLAVSKNGKLVYIKGYGVTDNSTNEAVTTSSRFRLASVSKTFTGVAIMKLVQDGKLTLDSKVFGSGAILGTEYGSAPYNTNLSNITVRHLLQNTSGSWGATTGGDVIDQNPTYTQKQFLDWVLLTRPNPSVPGSVYNYSNVGYWIAGRVIEKVTGKSYITYIKEIMASVGDIHVDIAGKTFAERKPGEVKYHGQGTDASYTYNIAFPRRDSDGGLIATATGVLKLITAVDGFNTRADILNSTSLTAFNTSSAHSTYALGIAQWPQQQLSYNYGSLPGTRTGFMRGDNGMCVSLLLNSRVVGTHENTFIQAMQTLMLDVIKNPAHNWQAIDQF